MSLRKTYMVLVYTLLQMGFWCRVAALAPNLSQQHQPHSFFFSSSRILRRRATLSLVPSRQFASRPPVSGQPDNNDEDTAAKFHRVTWKTADKDICFTAAHGETVRTAALRRGLVSPHNGRANLINCRGLGTCGTCAVQIDGNVEPVERSVKEELRLNFPPHGGAGSGDASSTSLRLACQVQVQGDITVTKRTGFWGQYNEVAVGSVPTQPFGEFEFLLDDKSPPSQDDVKVNSDAKK